MHEASSLESEYEAFPSLGAIAHKICRNEVRSEVIQLLRAMSNAYDGFDRKLILLSKPKGVLIHLEKVFIRFEALDKPTFRTY